MKTKNKKQVVNSSKDFFSMFNSHFSFGSIAFAFLLTILAPLMLLETASAYGQVQLRSVELSNSVVSATNVTYNVSFEPSTTANIGGIDVDFCSNDPIIGDSCTAPTGFSLTASPAITQPTGFSTANGTYAGTSNGAHNLLFLTDPTNNTPSSTSNPISFTITNVTNPSTLGTFYARILTYDTQADANAYTSGSVPSTGILDAGGAALSTVQAITITSKVQEVITFCVYTVTFDPGDCSAATGTAVALGNNHGVLSTAGPFVDNTTKYDIQTNALHNVTIRFTGTVPTSGSNVIEASTNSGMGATATSAYASASNSPQFGLCTWAAGGTTANLTPSAPYNDSNCHSTTESATTGTPGGTGGANFGFNIANASSTYGDVLATEAPGAYAQGEIAFIGNISNTTVAGIYQTTLTFIATGQY